MNDSTMTDIDLFFEDPAIPPTPSGEYSVLYLLRRDIKTCLGIDPNTGNSIDRIVWFPGAMAILAGIDLLGKFLAGCDDTGGNEWRKKVGGRFRAFVKKYFKPISSGDEETIYQLRNALLHSFGLYSEKRSGTVCRIYKFGLNREGGPLVAPAPSGGDNYLIDVLTLHNKFETAIERYRADLKASKNDLQGYFKLMFPKYGKIHIGATDITIRTSAPDISSWQGSQNK